jgi:hypothetical protein
VTNYVASLRISSLFYDCALFYVWATRNEKSCDGPVTEKCDDLGFPKQFWFPIQNPGRMAALGTNQNVDFEVAGIYTNAAKSTMEFQRLSIRRVNISNVDRKVRADSFFC